MSLPTFTMRELLEAGIHYGHHPRRWNPKMAPYLFGVRNKIHIIDLAQTFPMLQAALQKTHDIAKDGGRVLFVGTKSQASDIISTAAQQCGQYYVNHRWLGGMMTNWKTVSQSIKRLTSYEEQLADESAGFTKKERLKLQRAYDKLERALGGIREMGGTPDLLIVIDTNKEETAVKEARKLGVPIIGIVDSNSDPTIIDYPIPGNDDAIRSIDMYCGLFSKAILDGLQAQMAAAGVDIGASAELPAAEQLPIKEKAEEKPKKVKAEAKKEEKPAAKKAAPKKAKAAEEEEKEAPKAPKKAEVKEPAKKPAAKKATAAKAKEEKPALKKAAAEEEKPALKKAETKTTAKPKAPAKKTTAAKKETEATKKAPAKKAAATTKKTTTAKAKTAAKKPAAKKAD